MTDQQIAKAAGPTPAAITVQGSEQLLPKLAFAAFDGTGAGGSFLPCIKLIGPSGQVAGQAVGDVVAAGASVDQTWFRGLANQSAAPVSVVGRELLQSNTPTTIASGSFDVLPWDHFSGASLLDLTNPTAPKMKNSGRYGISMMSIAAGTMNLGANYRVGLFAQVGGSISPVYQTSGPATAFDPGPVMTCTLVCEIFAGRVLGASISNWDSAPVDFFISQAIVQRLS